MLVNDSLTIASDRPEIQTESHQDSTASKSPKTCTLYTDTTSFVPKYSTTFGPNCHPPVPNPAEDFPMAASIISQGIPGIPRVETPASNDGITLLVVICFLLVITAYNTGYKLFIQMLKHILDVERKSSIFIEKTMNESKLSVTLFIQTGLMQGIILYNAIRYLYPQSPTLGVFTDILCSTAVAILFYTSQWLIFHILGFVFTTRYNTHSWIDSFASLNSLFGVFVFPIVLFMVYLPSSAPICLALAFILYIMMRIIFIYKGIKIFLRDIYGFLYFILYLCALEILPLFLLYKGSVLLYSFVELKIL